jgi:hypothetical protein
MPSSRMLFRVALLRTDVRSVCWLLVTANVIPSSPILATLLIEDQRSFETSVLTRATRHNTSEDGILHSHRRENLKSLKMLFMRLLRSLFGETLNKLFTKPP